MKNKVQDVLDDFNISKPELADALADAVLTVRGIKTAGMPADWQIAHGEDPGPLEVNVSELVAEYLDAELRHNFPRSLKAQSVYKRVGLERIKRFVSWVKSDEKRLSFAWTYARDPEKIWQDLPQSEAGVEHPTGLQAHV